MCSNTFIDVYVLVRYNSCELFLKTFEYMYGVKSSPVKKAKVTNFTEW
jgi:hypothetical protein